MGTAMKTQQHLKNHHNYERAQTMGTMTSSLLFQIMLSFEVWGIDIDPLSAFTNEQLFCQANIM